LAEQAISFGVQMVAVADAALANTLTELLTNVAARLQVTKLPQVIAGPEAAAVVAASDCDVVLNGITGAAGLMPTVAALTAGHQLALANKESLVIGGRAVTSLASADQIVPVDSEHSALAQCLRAGTKSEVRKLVLTASGGPFRNATRAQLESVTPEQALNHPTWSMGPVVTINSATMFNKGLEIIEAHLLFDIPFEQIDVVVHPQSVVHSMVEFVDGSTIAQASPPDMHLPIALGLGWPDRVANSGSACDWSMTSQWTFEPVNDELFPAVQLAKRVGQFAGTAPAVMNGANEIAVAAFLAGRLTYLGIIELVQNVVEQHMVHGFIADEQLTIDDVVTASSWAMNQAAKILEQRTA
jgi:1-deoxy-D-xylulose-5-phosphate reductoisomerase